MKKELKGFVFILSFMLIISLTFVSAGWFGGAWTKITGDATSSKASAEKSDIASVVDSISNEKMTSENSTNNTDCIDSDGMNYYNKGTRVIDGVVSVDTCSDKEGFVDAYQSEHVLEYYCIGEETAFCLEGCVEGRCLPNR